MKAKHQNILIRIAICVTILLIIGVFVYIFNKDSDSPLTKINYQLNGGENNINNPDSVEVSDISSITLHDPTKSGYAFDGWFLDEAFQTQIESFEDIETVDEITIYAKFTPIEYSIVYISQANNSGINPTTYTIESNFTLNDVVCDGYTFEGWFLDEQFTQPISSIQPGNIGNLTLYAKEVLTQYAINYVLNGGENNNNNPTHINLSNWSSATLHNASKTGY